MSGIGRGSVGSNPEDGIGLALMRLDRMAEAARTGAGFSAAGISVKPAKPDWAAF